MKSELAILKKCKRIAIMGGTFDPIHYGHLVAAEAVRQELDIERVLFIPSGRPPHKKGGAVSPSEHRYLMTALATATNPYFYVSRIEIDRPDFTYTVDTLKELSSLCRKDAKIYFITGADAVQQIFSWKDSESLLNLCEFVAVTRPGYNTSKLEKFIDELSKRCKSRIHILEVPALAISSTDIRNRVQVLKTIKYLLPGAVEQYINKFELYIDTKKMSGEVLKINKRLHSMVSPARFVHTQGVYKEAVSLAKAYGVSQTKATMAALLHDCAKDFKEEKTRQLCAHYHIELDDVMNSQIYLAHSFLGAKIAKDEFHVTDKDVLDAIKYHTTGRKKMTMLDKIIYLADYIEEGREDFEGLAELRLLAYEDLDKAVCLGLELTAQHIKEKGRILHPLGVDALHFYKTNVN